MCSSDLNASGSSRSATTSTPCEPAAFDGEGVEVGLHCSMHTLTLATEFLLELMALVAVADGFDRLFEADGDEQADDDGGDVDEEVAPGVGGVFGRMDVEQGAHSFEAE